MQQEFFIVLLILNSIIIHRSDTLSVYPAVAINVLSSADKINLFCIEGGGLTDSDVEWLNPNFQVIPNEDEHVYTIYFSHSPPGSYWCRKTSNHSIIAESKLILTNNLTLIEEGRTGLRDNNHDLVFNCSTNTLILQRDKIGWARLLDYTVFLITETHKYSMSSSELIIHNATRDDKGKYACYANDTNTVHKVIDITAVEWPPELLSRQNQIIMVNVSEEVILNCTVSASPDPVYSWSFPESCSSCPNISSESVLIFIAEVSNSGYYICAAENRQGNLSLNFMVITVNNLTLIEEGRTGLRDNNHDLVFNCSTSISVLQDDKIGWARVLDDSVFVITETHKYSMSSSELIIHNATRDDKGKYACYANDTNTVYKVTDITAIEWPPELLFEQNQIITVNVSEEVILNCTVSVSPDPVYSWSFPESCSSCPNTSNDSALIFTAEITNSGDYICVVENRHGNLSLSFMVIAVSYPTFQFSNDTNLFEQKVTLLESDVFLNCSVDYGTEPDNITIWTLDGELVWINETSKYNVNASGLTVYNVTAEDQGNYTCNVHCLTATTFLDVVWPPKLLIKQYQTIKINVSEQVTLNCTVSALPDPMYSWSIPDSCISCPKKSFDDVIIFTTNFTDVGDHLFTCNATNNYGNITITFTVHVISKPIMLHSQKSIIKDRSNVNVMLTCDVKYAYPTAKITWNITTESSNIYRAVEENSTGNYILHNNGSLEIYHRFIYEEDHVMVMCLATNKYGFAHSVFHVWDPERFNRVETFKLYIKACTCQDLKYKTDKLFTELREWFSTVCDCDGLNNLHEPQLECMNETTGSLTSRVHHEGNNAAKTLIDLATVNMQKQDPPSAHLPSGWMVCLNPYCIWECDDSSSGGGGYMIISSLVLYLKNLTSCQNYISSPGDLLQSSLQEWLKSLCSCELQMISFQPTCYDESTVMIMMTMTIEHHNNVSMEGVIEREMNKSGSSIFHMHSGLAICINPDCQLKDKLNNSINTAEKSDDKNSTPMIAGLVAGALCAIIILSLIVLVLVMIKRKLIQGKHLDVKASTNEGTDHIYDELSLFTMKHMDPSIVNKTPSPKSDKVIFDTKGIEPPAYQPLPIPRYESCSTTSVARSNHSNDYHIEEDARSITDTDCYFEIEKDSKQHEETSKEHESYCKLYHLK